jgi:hypothetical protein
VIRSESTAEAAPTAATVRRAATMLPATTMPAASALRRGGNRAHQRNRKKSDHCFHTSILEE